MNQNPEARARDEIDRQLRLCGWIVQDVARISLGAEVGVALRECRTDVGPADYVLFVDGAPVGVIEAKREEERERLSVHEDQAEGYAASKLKHLDNEPLSFAYVSNGQRTLFTDYRDPKPRAREVFSFHRPETMQAWLRKPESLRGSLQGLGELPTDGLRDCQIDAIANLERSFKANRPRALVQMATGAGKTFTAITCVYRLLKYTNARRILFLVDTKNLGEQAEQEFISYRPSDDNRKFTELYSVHRLKSRHIPGDCQVYISTIQRLYAILKGTELEESAEEENPAERWQPKEAPPVEYSEHLSLEYFDFIVIDECHRSIYNLWMQVLDYFDAFQVGLTATPDARTFAYFRQNLVSEYSHETAVADGVNVGYDVFLIETKISGTGATLWKSEYVERRERLSRRRRLELQEEDETYAATQLDRDIVNPNQIRTVIRAFRDHLPGMFPVGLPPAEVEAAVRERTAALRDEAARAFTGELNEYLENVRRVHEQKIDLINPDEVTHAGWGEQKARQATETIEAFRSWVLGHRDEMVALQLFYAQSYRRRASSPSRCSRTSSPRSSPTSPPSRRCRSGAPTRSSKARAANPRTSSSRWWLYLIKEQIASSVRIETEDLDYTPFDAAGGRGLMRQLFGDEMYRIIDELNEALVA